jgi:hypothetical protein
MKTNDDSQRELAVQDQAPASSRTALSDSYPLVQHLTIASPNIPQRVIDKLSERLFLPAQRDYSISLRRPWFALSFLLLLLVAAGSLPFIQTFILGTYPDFHVWLKTNASIGKATLESASIFLEIFIAIFIGGSIMSERLALTQPVRDLIENVQESMNASLKNQAGNLEEYFKSLPERAKHSLPEIVASLVLLRAGVTYTNFFWRLGSLFDLSKDFYVVVRRELPRYARNFVAVKLITSFPGGLYGLVTYFLFFWLIIIRVFKLYFDAA